MQRQAFQPNNPKQPHDWSTDALIVMFLMLGILTPYLVVYQNTPLILMLALTIGMLMLLFIGYVVGKITRSDHVKPTPTPLANTRNSAGKNVFGAPEAIKAPEQNSGADTSNRRFSVRY